MSAMCALATSAAVAPGTSWMSMYIGISISGNAGKPSPMRLQALRRLRRRGTRRLQATSAALVGQGDLGRLAQRLKDDAIALGQAQQSAQLVFRRIGVQIEMEADALKSNRGVLGDTQRAAKIEIAFGFDRAAANDDADRGRHGVEGYPRASDEPLKQHIPDARAQAVAAGRRMQPRDSQRLPRLQAAGNAFAQAAPGL